MERGREGEREEARDKQRESERQRESTAVRKRERESGIAILKGRKNSLIEFPVTRRREPSLIGYQPQGH